MPLSLSTTLLISALALSDYAGTVMHVLVWTMIGLAVANEALRTFITRNPPPQAQGRPAEYEIPGAPREVRNPIVPPDYDPNDEL